MTLADDDQRLLRELCEQHGVSTDKVLRLLETVRDYAYAKRAASPAPYPDFPDVLELAALAYDADGKKDDSLIEVLRDLSDFDLFWRHGSEGAPMDRVSNRTMLIDVHAMPVLKELVAYLVIERLYKEMATLPDSPVTESRRTIRTILVIDEAHNYQTEISRLEPWQVIARSPEKMEEFVKFTAEAFYKSYS